MGRMNVSKPYHKTVRAKSRNKLFVNVMLIINLLVSTAALLKGFDII